MSDSYLRIKPGERVTEAVIRFCSDGSDGVPRYVHLTGMIETTKLTPAPGADPLIIPTKAYLVNGTALIKDDRAKIMGTLSWQLNGETHRLPVASRAIRRDSRVSHSECVRVFGAND